MRAVATGPQGQGKIEDVAVTCLKKMGIARVLIVVTGGCAQKGFYFGGIDLPLLSNPTIIFFLAFSGLFGILHLYVSSWPHRFPTTIPRYYRENFEGETT